MRALVAAVVGLVIILVVFIIFLNILVATHIIRVHYVNVLMTLQLECARPILVRIGGACLGNTTVATAGPGVAFVAVAVVIAIVVAIVVGSRGSVLTVLLLHAVATKSVAVGLLMLQSPVLLDLFLELSDLLRLWKMAQRVVESQGRSRLGPCRRRIHIQIGDKGRVRRRVHRFGSLAVAWL